MSIIEVNSIDIYSMCFKGCYSKTNNEVLGATINQITNKDLFNFHIPSTSSRTKSHSRSIKDTDELIQTLEKRIAKKRNIKQGAMQKLLTPKEGWETKLLPKVCWFQEGPGVRKSQFTSLCKTLKWNKY